MDENNKYILIWREHVLKAADALRNNDFDMYEKEIAEMEEAYEDYKKDKQLSYFNESSFGSANAIFESALMDLYKRNPKAIKEVVKTIKEDKNLHAQFLFLEALKQCKKEYDITKYVNDAVALAKKDIDSKTLMESNKKLYAVLRKYDIKATEPLNEGKLEFYNICDNLFKNSNTSSLMALGTLNDNINKVVKFVNEEVSKNKENKNKEVKSLQEFANKCNEALTNGEKEILSILLDTNNEAKQKKLFETKKKECLDKIKKVMNESEDSEKERLNNIYASLSSKTYNKKTVVEEVVKMLEIFDIFED